MKANQENKRSMYGTVGVILDENKSVWETLPAFVTAVDELSSGIETIDSLAQSRNGKTTGLTRDKQTTRDAMMRQFKTSQAGFFAAYKTARVIVDNPASRNGKNGGNGSNGHDSTPKPPPKVNP